LVIAALFDTDGIDLASGDFYSIDGTSVLSSDTLGTGIVTSSLTTIGILNSGSISSGFGHIDNGVNNYTTGGQIIIDVDGTDIGAVGSLTVGANTVGGLYADSSTHFILKLRELALVELFLLILKMTMCMLVCQT